MALVCCLFLREFRISLIKADEIQKWYQITYKTRPCSTASGCKCVRVRVRVRVPSHVSLLLHLAHGGRPVGGACRWPRQEAGEPAGWTRPLFAGVLNRRPDRAVWQPRPEPRLSSSRLSLTILCFRHFPEVFFSFFGVSSMAANVEDDAQEHARTCGLSVLLGSS